MRRRSIAFRTRAASQPRPINRRWLAFARAICAEYRARADTTRTAYLAVLGLLATWNIADPGAARVAIVAWVVAGANVAIVASWLDLDRGRRRQRHDASGLPAVRGWRLVSGVAGIDPELLLTIDALVFLFDHARLATVPVRGSRRRTRTTYAQTLRLLIRDQWGPSRGVSGRRAERLLRDELCRRHGLVRRVPVGTATAYRLVDESVESALVRLETSAGRPLIAWRLGRDPRWDDPVHPEGGRA
jgi:hypothetical protein